METKSKPRARTAKKAIALTVSNPFMPTECKVTKFERQTTDTYTLKLSAKLVHEPGQFVQVTLPRVGECPISISSYSGEELELNIKQVGNMTNALAELRKGDTVYIRGPYGKGYPVKELKGNNLIMIGGGCGIAPLKGIIEYVERHRADYGKIQLFFGCRTPEDLLFKEHHNRWKDKFDLSLSVDQNPANTCFEGNVGFVTAMLEKASLEKDGSVAFMCGPPKMMAAAAQVLHAKGFHDDQIFVSAERLMYCAIGKCCHCMIREKFTCIDGPVFRYDEIGGIQE
jgi:anaerobic sulfite reductase subunit B